MTQVTINAAELARIVKAVEKSAAKDDSRPVLAGIHASISGDRLTLAAAHGFRPSTAYATLDAPAETDATAILERAGLLGFGKSLKPKTAPVASIDVPGDGWTFSAYNTRATVRLIDGSFRDISGIIGEGSEPAMFTIDPRFLRDLPLTETVTIGRARDDAHAPLFFTAADGVRHVIMPMVKSERAGWQRREDAAPEPVAAEVEPEPEPVTPAESA